jgi:hypothetical protein
MGRGMARAQPRPRTRMKRALNPKQLIIGKEWPGPRPCDGSFTTVSWTGQEACPTLNLHYETVSYPWLREDILGLGGIRFDLFPELIDEDAQIFGLFAIIGAPDGLQ